MSGPSQRFYEDDEAEEILHLAASISSSDSKMSYERLLETAAELGISPEAVEAAEKKVLADRQERALKAQFATAQRQAYFAHLISFICIQAGFLAINLLTSPHELWFYWPMIGWGIGLVTHTIAFLFPSSNAHSREFQRWKAGKEAGPRNGEHLQETGNYGPKVVVGVHVGGHGYEERLQARLERAKAKIDRIESRSRINRF